MPARIAGYDVVEQLYEGSRTVVYRAVRETDQHPVVIKVLRDGHPSFSELVQFRNQYAIAQALTCQVANQLDRPGIVQPISLEPYANGYALVMEDIGGISLRHYIQVAPLTLEQFWPIALHIIDILHQLYQQRIIHKDVKPANILIQPETGQIKLIDFSIASLLPRETQEVQNPNVLEGTLAYISPEQTGRMNRGIDYRSDFYSLGVTFFELLTGQLPFQADDPMEMVHAHLAKQPLSVCDLNPELPVLLGEIVYKLMAKNAEDRYQSALGLKHDLMRCQDEYQAGGKHAWFQLGERDISDRFLIPEKLYGREQEVQTLLDAFGRVANGASELMLVAGFSGIGKTAVVNEVHKPIVRWHGYFIKGKYDQFNRNLPFSAFLQAFRDLMGQLLSHDDAQLAEWKAKILAAVGDNGQVLIEVIPELEQVIGSQPPVPELSGSAAQNRFNLLFQKFITVFTTPEHPLVIFLDDLQWADSASLNLLKLLLTEREAYGSQQHGYLFVIGAYRDNEVFPTHPLMLMLDEVKKAAALIHTLTLAPLSQADVNQLTADTLSCSTELAQPLTQLVYQKTQGNPFFLTQFLKALHEDGYISFDFQVGHWQCDLATVRLLALTDDVVEFMALQLQKLPPASQTALKLAACVGAQFDLATLAIVSQQSPEETAIALWKALQEGVILPISDVYKFYQPSELEVTDVRQPITFNCSYRFLHDRVQQAAYSLIPDAQKQTTHYQIGQLLLQQVSPAAREERIFEIVNQLNYGTALVEAQAERDELAQLNLTACRKARLATAYQAALEYATVALQLLGAEAWQRQYEMTLALHDLAAEVAFLAGAFEQMDQWIAAVIQQAKTPLEQVQVYQVRIQALVARNQFVDAIAIGQAVFRMLGVNLPDEPTLEDIHQLKQDIDVLIEGRSIESFFHLPKMTDPHQLAIMQNAARLTPVCYMSGTKLYFLVVALQVKLSIQYGNSPVSPFCYVGYAFQLRMLWSDMSLVPQFGQLGYQLALEPDAKNIRAATAMLMGAYVGSWTIHLQDTLPILLDGYQAGLETGNLEFMGYDAQLYCFNAYWYGQPLAELEPQIRAYYQQLADLHQVTAANCVLAYWQAAQILLGQPEGQAEDEMPLRQDAYEQQVLDEAKVDFYRLSFFYLYRFTLNYWLEDFAKAEQDAAQTRQYLAGGMGSIVEPIFYFYDALTVLATPPESLTESEPRWQRMLEDQAKLKEWAEYGSMNYLHKFDLVQAEYHRVLDRKTEAIELYDRAIAGAKDNGYQQEAALANELAAKFYLSWDKERIAQAYLIEAYYGYARWGAKAKLADLEYRYPQLLTPILQQAQTPLSIHETVFATGTVTSTSTSSTRLSDSLDLVALLKASQTLSSEIEQEQLISTLLLTVMQTSGATHCTLMLNEGAQLTVQARAELTESNHIATQILHPAQSLADSGVVPISLVTTVKRNRQPVVITNAAQDPLLTSDVYIQNWQPKSLLCSPILQQGKLLGIVYLENNLATGAFTRDRVELLNLLCAQAAISLENARLYQQSQQALIQLRDNETRFQNLAANIPGMVYRFCLAADGLTSTPYVSSGCRDLYELDPADVMAGKHSITAMHHPDDDAAVQQALMESIQNLTPFMEAWRIITPSGQVKWLQSAARPEKKADGSVVWDGVVLDVSDRKRAEAAVLKKSQELEQALAELQTTQLQMVQSEKMATLGNLVAGVAHEINNPIGFLNGSINNATDYVRDLFEYLETYHQHQAPTSPVVELATEIDLDFLLDDLPKLLDSMRRATDRIKSISTSLRTFSRADTEHKVSANLHEGIDSTLLILKYRLKASECRPAIEVVHNYGELPEIACFPGQLNQVFMNILANAIDVFDEMAQQLSFSELEANPQSITIQTVAVPDQNRVEIRIRDNGKGMTEEVRSRIFDHLFTTKDVGKGTGLGLAIAHQIVTDTHGGQITVNSTLGQGSEFCICLPIAAQ